METTAILVFSVFKAGGGESILIFNLNFTCVLLTLCDSYTSNYMNFLWEA